MSAEALEIFQQPQSAAADGSKAVFPPVTRPTRHATFRPSLSYTTPAASRNRGKDNQHSVRSELGFILGACGWWGGGVEEREMRCRHADS